ncbi:hypothetical protein EDB85DRAFT_2153653 [Lactarius pseudohatsudake]|nr:hypothetical protein EDB85DRAFT_2153653 [Lactarius pseudohatsudake]
MAPGPFLTNLAPGDKFGRIVTLVSMTIYLPFEILTAIFEEVDDVRDIWHIRAASRTFCAAATPFAFHIAAHVRQVAYLGTGADRMGSTLMYGYGPQFGSESGALAFQSLALQPSILGALAASFDIRVSPKLTSLSLHNLRIWELSPLESPPFQTALTTLRCFQLSLLLDGPPAAEIYDPWCNLWGTLCSRMVLTPMQHSLTELTLHRQRIC